MDETARGTVLAIAGVVLFAVTIATSAALAPTIGATDADDKRETLVGSQGGGPGWHEFGSVYLLRGTNVTWREASADSYFDVTRAADGRVLAGYMHGGYDDCGPYETPCARTGFRVIDPAGPAVVSEYGFPVRSRKNSEVHDVEQLPTGEYLLTDMERERIVAVENGEVTWEWRASELYDAPADPTTTDWLHVNDVDVIGEGRYLVSVRNANQLVIVERGRGAVEVINADRDDADDRSCRRPDQLVDRDGDGDIRCGDPDVLNHQHNPQWLGDGAVLVADSDNDRVVELHRDDDGVWRPAWELRRAGDLAFRWPRDADRLPTGKTLITDTLNKRIVEVTESGEVVWSVRTQRIPYEADRLPAGEAVGAPRYNATDVASRNEEVPLLSPLLVLLKAIVPALPFWFAEPQLLLTLASVGLVCAGVALRYRGRG